MKQLRLRVVLLLAGHIRTKLIYVRRSSMYPIIIAKQRHTARQKAVCHTEKGLLVIYMLYLKQFSVIFYC